MKPTYNCTEFKPLTTLPQAAFHVFGMELLTQLDLAETDAFFNTFFSLPASYWRGFLGASLSAGQLLVFALLTFAIAPISIKWRLVTHLLKGAL
jgi:lycopene epsilon-cyclase